MSMLKGVLSNSMRPWLRARAQSSSIAVRDWLIEIADNPSIDIEALYNALADKVKFTDLFIEEVIMKTGLKEAVRETQAKVLEELYNILAEYKASQSPQEAPKSPEEPPLTEEAILRELPSKTKVFIDKEVFVISNWRFILKLDSRKIIYIPQSPAEAYMLLDHYYMGNREEAVKYILEKRGLGETGVKAVIESIEPIPFLYVYLLNKNYIGLSPIKLGLGELEARLKPFTLEDYDRLREELGPEFNRLGPRIAKALGIKYDPRSQEPISEARQFIFWIERGIPEDILEKLLKVVYPKAIELWDKLEAHELLRAIYKAMILPWPRGEDLPHLLLITPTRSGKSGLYYLATGEEPYINATSVSLIGGYDANSRSFIIGKLNGRDIALQIESIETDKARDLAEYLIEYMRAGKTRRSVLGRDIQVEGSAPLIFTGNPAGEGKRGVKLQDWINYGLLKNPEALGSRLLLFYLIEAPRIDSIPEELKAKMRIIWEIARSSQVKRLIAEKWDSPLVKDWLRESDSPIPIPVYPNEALTTLFQYLNELAKHYWRGLKALALQIAIANNLHRLGEIAEEDLITEADKTYLLLKDYLVKSIEIAVSDISKNAYSDINVRVKTWPNLLQKALIGINDILNKRAIGSGKAEIPLTEILKALGEKGLIKLRPSSNPYSSYNIRLKQYMKAKEKELEEIGITLAESTNMVIVDIEAFKGLDIEGLIVSLEGK